MLVLIALSPAGDPVVLDAQWVCAVAEKPRPSTFIASSKEACLCVRKDVISPVKIATVFAILSKGPGVREVKVLLC